MKYSQFLESLFDSGRVTVPGAAPLEAEDLEAGDEVLAGFERNWRLEMPGDAPAFRSGAARWAAIKFFRACQFTVFRDFGEDALNEALGDSLLEAPSAGICYSVDIVFRYLPSLAKLAGSAAERDPLLEYIMSWARQWPLSSVGIREVDAETIDKRDLGPITEAPSLLTLYVDRIIATDDVSRLANPIVRESVRSALGMFGDLKSGIRDALNNYETEEKVE